MPKAKIITIASGKGGVGKSIFSANMGYLLNSMGYKVAILDANFGLSSQDIIFNVTVTKTLTDFLKATASLSEVVLELKDSLYLIPTDSGDEMSEFDSKFIVDRFFDEATFLEKIDYLIIDTAPSIDTKTQEFFKISDSIIVLSTDDPLSITDSYTTLKIASKYTNNLALVLNMVNKKQNAVLIYNKIKKIINKHLNSSVDIEFLGHISYSKTISNSSYYRQLFAKEHPNSLSFYQLSEIIYNFLIKLEHKVLEPKVRKSFTVFVSRLIEKF